MAQRGTGGGFIDQLVFLKNLVGMAAVLGIFYLMIPWRFVRLVLQTDLGEMNQDLLAQAVMDWATQLPPNLMMTIVLLMIAVLTLGLEALKLLD